MAAKIRQIIDHDDHAEIKPVFRNPIYRRWRMMINKYQLDVAPEWMPPDKVGFKNYVTWLLKELHNKNIRPSEDLRVVRKDPSRFFCPDNCIVSSTSGEGVELTLPGIGKIPNNDAVLSVTQNCIWAGPKDEFKRFDEKTMAKNKLTPNPVAGIESVFGILPIALAHPVERPKTTTEETIKAANSDDEPNFERSKPHRDPYYSRWNSMIGLSVNPDRQPQSHQNSRLKSFAVDPAWMSPRKTGFKNYKDWITKQLEAHPEIPKDNFMVARHDSTVAFGPENCFLKPGRILKVVPSSKVTTTKPSVSVQTEPKKKTVSKHQISSSGMTDLESVFKLRA